MQETWSNTWVNAPLTAASIQSVIDSMQACDEESIASAWRAVARLAQKLVEPIKRGRYEQQQRRRAQGVWASRSERRARIERQIVGLLENIEMFEGML